MKKRLNPRRRVRLKDEERIETSERARERKRPADGLTEDEQTYLEYDTNSVNATKTNSVNTHAIATDSPMPLSWYNAQMVPIMSDSTRVKAPRR